MATNVFQASVVSLGNWANNGGFGGTVSPGTPSGGFFVADNDTSVLELKFNTNSQASASDVQVWLYGTYGTTRSQAVNVDVFPTGTGGPDMGSQFVGGSFPTGWYGGDFGAASSISSSFSIEISGDGTGDGSETIVLSGGYVVLGQTIYTLSFSTEPSNSSPGTLNAIVVHSTGGSSDTDTITISKASGPAAIGGTTAVKLTSGNATFSGVTAGTTGTYTLAASSTDDTSVTSTSFVLSSSSAIPIVVLDCQMDSCGGGNL